MHEATLEWDEAGQVKNYTIQAQQPSKNLGSVRIGRDPMRCDLVLAHPTVSGLHIEIFFNNQCEGFWVRNLRESNPPLVDGAILQQGEKPLSFGSRIQLGQLELKVVSVTIAASGVVPTILLDPQACPAVARSQTRSIQYGLKCPHCDRISPHAQLEMGCPWCGTSLAAAVSVVLPPS